MFAIRRYVPAAVVAKREWLSYLFPQIQLSFNSTSNTDCAKQFLNSLSSNTPPAKT